MKGLRRVAAMLLIPLLVALLAVPAGAAATPKTNEIHESWLKLDPLPATTDAAQVTLTGKVAGNFDMTVENGAFVNSFAAKGDFSIMVDLVTGENRIHLSGVDRANRLLNYEVVITRTGGGEDPDEPTDPDEPGTTPTELFLEVGQNTLVANGISTMTIRVLVLDENGDRVLNYAEPITVTSSNPAAIAVPTSPVAVQGGIAEITLRAGTVSAEATITVTAPGLGAATTTLTPAPQLAGRLSMTATSATLALGGGTPGSLQLRLKDSNGLDVYEMATVLHVQLRSNNVSVAHFGNNKAMLDLTMSVPTASVAIYGGTTQGSTTITGVAIRSDGLAIPVDVITVSTTP